MALLHSHGTRTASVSSATLGSVTPRVRALGKLEIRDGGTRHEPPSHKTVALLAYLALHESWIERHALASIFWPEADGERARSNLRSLLARTKKLPFSSGLEVDDTRVRWHVECDVAEFRTAIADGRWGDAVRLRDGELLRGLELPDAPEFDAWLRIERESAMDAFRFAVVRLAKGLADAGRTDEALAHVDSLLRADPLNEDAVQLAMRLYGNVGRPARAEAVYRAFRDRLAHAYDLKPTSATRSLAEAVASRSAPAPAPREPAPTTTTRGVSPSQLTSFVGRTVEIEELSTRLEQPDCRLVTIVGTGGVGKTRLALRAADLAAARYPDGVVVVPLEGVIESTAVVSAIAQGLGVPPRSPGAAGSQVIHAIGGRSMLIVLDNFEHVRDAARELPDLLVSCPRLDVVVTSRERLGIAEEWLLPLGGLPYPDAPRSDAETYDAVRCILARIRQVRPDFVLTDASLPHVIDICRLVDGLPLGLELAAVWTRAMPIADIAIEIERNLDFLRDRRRATNERHQSIRAALEHSWNLLTDAERDVLRKLAVFRGGFRQSAAAFVAGASIAVLAALVDKSLLRASLDGRYDRHPLVHTFTLEKLASDPLEERDARERHARYFAWLLEQAEPHRGAARQAEWVSRLEPESDNLSDALGFALRNAHGGLALRLVPAMRWRGWPDAQVAERFDLVTRVLALPASAPSSARAHALHIASVLAQNLRDRAAARSFGEEALALADVDGMDELTSWLRSNLAVVALQEGDITKARHYLTECLERRAAVGPLTGFASALNQLATIERADGNLEVAQAMHEEALAMGRKTHDTLTLCRSLNGLGYVARARGDIVEARRLLEDGLAVATAHRHDASAIAALHAMASIAHEAGDPERGKHLHAEALELELGTEAFRLLHRSLDAVGELLAAEGETGGAVRLWGAAQALRDASGVRLPKAHVASQEQRLAQARAKSGADVVDDALRAGSAMDARRAIADALESLRS